MGNKKTRRLKSSKNRSFNTKHYLSGDGMVTSIWGPNLWHYLHTISFNYPVKPTNENKKYYKQFICNLQHTLPCKHCRINLIKNLKLTQFLGDTLEAIAHEKGGIIKSNIPVVIGETQPEIQEVFKAIAQTNNSAIVFADKATNESYKSDLLGAYQIKNIGTAVQTLEVLKEKGFKIWPQHIKDGLLHVVNNTGLLGRWQVLQTKPKVVCDTGHNREGLTYVMNQLLNEKFDALHIVFGVVNDKDLSSIADVLPREATYYFCKPDIPRGMDAAELKSVLNEYRLFGNAYSSVKEAYNSALENSNPEDFIFVGGSTFVVSEIL